MRKAGIDSGAVFFYIPVPHPFPTFRMTWRREVPLNWRWIARRTVISAFVLLHLSALAIWTMPDCAIKTRFTAPYRYYMLPLGLWQWWAIFAPDPLRENRELEAEVVDAKGMIHIYEFTKIGDMSGWQKLSRYRHPKYTDNVVSGGEFAKTRDFAARHVVRDLGFGAEAFPLTVSLYARVTDPPPEGTATIDTMAAPRIHMIERYQFASLKEVRP
jgi:hypothetical protein